MDVRLWARPGVFNAKLDDDFAIFFSGVAAAVRVPAAAARLYFFRGAVELAKRVPITDSASLQEFSASREAVWVFDGGPASPDTWPERPADRVKAAPQSLGSGRSSTQQSFFRTAVLNRDGSVCVLCGITDVPGAKSVVQAAHVIAVTAPQAVLDSARVLNVYDTNNGVTLCGDCHLWYDKLMWCVRGDGTVAVADALCERVNCERWREFRGRSLRVPPEPALRAYWPPPNLWSVQECLFEAACVTRHDTVAAQPIFCDKCGQRSTKPLGSRHKCVLGRHVFTPFFTRAYPDLAAAAAEAAARSAGGGGEGRRLFDAGEHGGGGNGTLGEEAEQGENKGEGESDSE